MYVLGALVAYALLLRWGRLNDPLIPRSELARLYIVCYVLGYFGARFLSILVEEPDVKGFWGTLGALGRLGPMTFYGGAIAACVGGILYARLKRLPLGSLLDLTIPAGLVALALGRVGCFLNGDDYGKAVLLRSGEAPPFWAVTFPNLGDGIARYPVQLMEAFAVLAIAWIIIRNLVKLRTAFRPGFGGFLGIVAYANLRFLLEFLRDDFRGFAFGTWLSTSQFISIVVLALCGLSIPYWIRSARALAAPEETP